MPPSRTGSSSKQTKSLRQGKLSFATSKRTASTSAADSQKKQQTIPPVKIIVDEESSNEESDDEEVEVIEAFEVGPVELKTIEDTPAYKRLHKNTVKARGSKDIIHPESQTKTHEILRVFDLSYQYGPCVGVTRLERWERANVLGLKPPAEVKDILLSKEALEDNTLKQCVFFEEEV